MRTLCRFSSGLIGALALAGMAFAQVPASNDTSDGNYNTGVGTNALNGPLKSAPGDANTAVGFQTLVLSTGSYNTAVGFQTLYDNYAGNWNTASGSKAMSDGGLNNNTNGSYNTADGGEALFYNSGSYNTASGFQALQNNDSGSWNTASGAGAMGGSSTETIGTATGSYNTAVGGIALNSNSSGTGNAALGYASLSSNTTGAANTASGSGAMHFNQTGNDNTAAGNESLHENTTGSDNTASGYQALYSNTTADYNTATGYQALYTSNANSNTASGYQALYADTSGADNTATGVHALSANTTGSSNIAEGWHAGYNLTTGSNNIDIGSPGVAAESGVIRIGTISSANVSTQTATYIAGIYGSTVSSPLPIYINSSGQLGTVMSSERFKTGIAPMGTNTEKLQQLRPVSFKLKSDTSGSLQYGLIAEEVAKVYPELVVRDAKGRIDGVRYDELAPMVLNIAQQQQRRMASQAKLIANQSAEISELKQRFAMLQAALGKLQPKDALVAQR